MKPIDDNEEEFEDLTHEQIVERLRAGEVFYPTQPGLKEAAREVFGPIVKGMIAKEIIHRYHVCWLMQIIEVFANDRCFRATGKRLRPFQDSSLKVSSAEAGETLRFGADWTLLQMRGAAIRIQMDATIFFPDPAVVAEIKAAAARNAPPEEIDNLLERAKGRKR